MYIWNTDFEEIYFTKAKVSGRELKIAKSSFVFVVVVVLLSINEDDVAEKKTTTAAVAINVAHNHILCTMHIAH